MLLFLLISCGYTIEYGDDGRTVKIAKDDYKGALLYEANSLGTTFPVEAISDNILQNSIVSGAILQEIRFENSNIVKKVYGLLSIFKDASTLTFNSQKGVTIQALNSSFTYNSYDYDSKEFRNDNEVVMSLGYEVTTVPKAVDGHFWVEAKLLNKDNKILMLNYILIANGINWEDHMAGSDNPLDYKMIVIVYGDEKFTKERSLDPSTRVRIEKNALKNRSGDLLYIPNFNEINYVNLKSFANFKDQIRILRRITTVFELAELVK